MTTKLLDRAGRWCRLGLFLLLAGLAACGPGTGGTGTGPLSFSGTAGSAAAPTPGLECPAGCDRVTLLLEPERVELRTACRRFVHVGAWTVSEDGKLVLEGTVETTSATGIASAPATLHLQFSEREPASSSVTAVLVGDAGVLAGPAVLQRAEGATGAAPADCTKP